MTVPTNIDTNPRVWVGCCFRYASGCLTGEWFPAIDAMNITLADVHGDADRACVGCEEMENFDFEGIPVDGALEVSQAAGWGRVLHEVDEHLRPALCAWVRSGSYTTLSFGCRRVVASVHCAVVVFRIDHS